MNDTVIFFIWSNVNLLLILNIYLFVAKSRNFKNFPLVAQDALVIFLSVILFNHFILSIFNSMSPFYLAALIMLITLLLFFYNFYFSNIQIMSKKLHVLNKNEKCIFFIVILVLILGIGKASVIFPTEWDSLNYHIPLINQWMQVKNLYAPNSMHWSNPGNNELFGHWLVSSFSGDFLIRFNNLLPCTLLILGIYNLSKEIGLTTDFSICNSLVVSMNGVFLNQLTNQDNDVSVASFFICSCFYTIRYTNLNRFFDVFLCALSFGILSGIKYYAIGYAIIIFILINLLARKKNYFPFKGIPTFTLIFGFIFLGSFWYIRNYVYTGTPLYPKGFTESTDLMLKIYPEIKTTSIFGNNSDNILWLYLNSIYQTGGFLLVFSILISPISVPFALCSCFWVNNLKRHIFFKNRLALTVCYASSIWLVSITPFLVEDEPGTLNQLHWFYCPARYSFCFLCLSSTFLFTLFYEIQNTLLNKKIYSVRFFFIPLILFFLLCKFGLFFSTLNEMQRHTTLFAGFCVLFIYIIYLVPKFNALKHIKIILLYGNFFSIMLGISLLVGNISRLWHENYNLSYMNQKSILSFINSGPDSRRKFCFLDFKCYYFFGSKRQNIITQPIFINTHDDLLRYFIYNKITIVIYNKKRKFKKNDHFSKFEKCLAEFPDAFKEIIETDDSFSIYEFSPKNLAEMVPTG